MAFNSLAAVERSTDGRTNPMVNPGAIATTILLPGTDEQKWQCLADGLSRFAGHELDVDQEVYVRRRRIWSTGPRSSCSAPAACWAVSPISRSICTPGRAV